MRIRTLLMTAIGSILATSIVMATPLSITPLSGERDVKVVLNQDEHHFAVTGGCNTVSGRVYVTDSGAFRVKQGRHGGGLASTMIACPDQLQKIDDRIASFILNTPKVVRQGDALYLVGTIENEAESVYLPVELDKGSYLDIEAKPYEQVFYYVSPETTLCEDGSDKRCLQIRQDKNAEWEAYSGTIEGFTPIENYEYRLRLKEYKNEDGTVRHVLDMVVEQGQVISQ